MIHPVFVLRACRTLFAATALLTVVSVTCAQTAPASTKTSTQAAAAGATAPGAAASRPAATKAAANAAAKPSKSTKSTKGRKPAPVPEPVVVELPPPEAADEAQIEAAERVFRGVYDCEFKVTITVTPSEKYPSYVDVRHGKADYLMKPVLSSTGAIRLEDVRGEALMVQISAKSMLLNLRTGHRIADECMSPRQRELMEARRTARAAEAAASAASAASVATSVSATSAASAAATASVAPLAVQSPASSVAPASAASAATTTVIPLQTK